jgi:hypothetical protein
VNSNNIHYRNIHYRGRRLSRGSSAAEVASLGWLLGASRVRCRKWTSENSVNAKFAEDPSTLLAEQRGTLTDRERTVGSLIGKT